MGRFVAGPEGHARRGRKTPAIGWIKVKKARLSAVSIDYVINIE
jgi:hypothetical protein